MRGRIRGRPRHRRDMKRTKAYHRAEMSTVHYHAWMTVPGPIGPLDVTICAKCGLVSRWGR